MTQIIPATLSAQRALRLDLAGPALFEACGLSIEVLATVADLPNLPTPTRLAIAKAMAKACEAHHLAKFGKIS
jgi:hypothetical protein